ncbi:Fic family protein [Hydrogenophaga intermedia]|uniref:Filamentation induced by cAMP protein Fic n=2 Tax=Comamonadaceae TaxID=80864 RepID=A0A1L1PP81_HYDIT|nr:Fic family protein [Hydrogenophaga intermedia]AOS80720.1 hypothetical protein Q5W_18000 [Hydrogenophaga sp. PBC]TMU78344.1 hypothetical protein FGJ01_03115 [Hydrogenophaga intermedia]CDN87155.1 Filamentation induced by cAMP protein Fic [Hydrogenophaga intermedia]
MAAGPHWDADSPELRANLKRIFKAMRRHAEARHALNAADIKGWHADMMKGLSVPEAADVGVSESDLKGAFRGPPRLAHVTVTIGIHEGVAPDRVLGEVGALLERVAITVAVLDEAIGSKAPARFTRDELRAVCELAGTLHGEWVRIHPFGNGNGRMARLLANWVLMRYGIEPVLSPRPRPEGLYELAARASMHGRHDVMVLCILSEIEAAAGRS